MKINSAWRSSKFQDKHIKNLDRHPYRRIKTLIFETYFLSRVCTHNPRLRVGVQYLCVSLPIAMGVSNTLSYHKPTFHMTDVSTGRTSIRFPLVSEIKSVDSITIPPV